MQPQLTEAEIAWLAGIYEGEGSAYYRKSVLQDGSRSTYVRVSISMTDLDIIERVQTLFPANGINVRKKREQPHHKPLYYWSLTMRPRVVEFLRLILPWLGERRTARALEVIELAENSAFGLGSQHRRKTCCPNGHPYNEENTYVATRRDGGINRQCRICRRASGRRQRDKRRLAKGTE